MIEDALREMPANVIHPNDAAGWTGGQAQMP
jgi:hypothetical protein